jgi:thiol-disulfide isomerase/thioredoxin
MGEVSSATEKGGAIQWGIVATLVGVLILAALGLVYVMRSGATELAGSATPGVSHEGPLRNYAKGSLAKLETWKAPRSEPTTAFNDAGGKAVSLASFRGKVVVMNIWATFCAPCRTEMPTLAAVQRKYQGTDLMVLPISMDPQSHLADAKNFIDVHDPLPLYDDPKFALPAAVGHVRGIPTTVIYDRQGREVARLEGETKWDTPEAYALFDALLKAK